MFSKEKARKLANQATGGVLITQAQKSFKGVTILTSRPEGMSLSEYKRLRKLQQKTIKQCLR